MVGVVITNSLVILVIRSSLSRNLHQNIVVVGKGHGRILGQRITRQVIKEMILGDNWAMDDLYMNIDI